MFSEAGRSVSPLPSLLLPPLDPHCLGCGVNFAVSDDDNDCNVAAAAAAAAGAMAQNFTSFYTSLIRVYVVLVVQ